jgi:peptide chain release factor 1
MFEKLEEVVHKFERLTEQMADPEIATDSGRFTKIAKERAEIQDVVEAYVAYKTLLDAMDDNEAMVGDPDPEIRAMALEELASLKVTKEKAEAEIQLLLLPHDPMDDKNTIIEIRAGTGGEEAALFAADLFRMYRRYADTQKWKMEILSAHDTGLGGYKEIVCLITGKKVFSRLKWESGVHRVQRVPETEAQGRVHTSAVTVAVLPEAEEVDVDIRDQDIRVDLYRASGAGGQHVNKTDSAVRLTHEPTGIVVACQDERSQHKNKAKAMKILRSKILEKEIDDRQKSEAADRKSQVGSGDRSERIRTYNFPQNRLTDHRIGLTLYKLDRIIEGELGELLDPLRAWFQAEALKAVQE